MSGPRALRHIALYSLVPLLALVSSLVVVRTCLEVGGTRAWAAIATGQAVGAAGGLLITYGWGLVGPTLVARVDDAAAGRMYRASTVMRLGLAVPCVPICAVITYAVAPDHGYRAAGVVACLAPCLQGLGAGWFLVGRARPWALLTVDAAPRLSGALLGVALVTGTEQILLLPLTQLLAEVGIAAVATARYARWRDAQPPVGDEVREHLREQSPLMVSVAASVAYTRLSVPIVALTSVAAVPVFAAIDQLVLSFRAMIRPIVNFFQSWVAQAGSDTQQPAHAERRRAVSAALATVTAGILGGVLVAVTLDGLLASVLFAGEIDFTLGQALLSGALVTVLAGSYSTSLYFLVPGGRTAVVARTSLIGCLVGVPAIVVGALVAGATGAVAGLLAAELVVLARQVRIAAVCYREMA